MTDYRIESYLEKTSNIEFICSKHGLSDGARVIEKPPARAEGSRSVLAKCTLAFFSAGIATFVYECKLRMGCFPRGDIMYIGGASCR